MQNLRESGSYGWVWRGRFTTAITNIVTDAMSCRQTPFHPGTASNRGCVEKVASLMNRLIWQRQNPPTIRSSLSSTPQASTDNKNVLPTTAGPALDRIPRLTTIAPFKIHIHASAISATAVSVWISLVRWLSPTTEVNQQTLFVKECCTSPATYRTRRRAFRINKAFDRSGKSAQTISYKRVNGV